MCKLCTKILTMPKFNIIVLFLAGDVINTSPLIQSKKIEILFFFVIKALIQL